MLQPYTFCHALFYPIQRIRKSDGTFAFTIRMHLPDSRVRDFEMDTAALAASSDMLKALSRYELMPSNNKDSTMHMTAYIRGPYSPPGIAENAEIVLASDPEMVGFSATTSGFMDAFEIAVYIRARRPEIKIVFGNVHVFPRWAHPSSNIFPKSIIWSSAKAKAPCWNWPTASR